MSYPLTQAALELIAYPSTLLLLYFLFGGDA